MNELTEEEMAVAELKEALARREAGKAVKGTKFKRTELAPGAPHARIDVVTQEHGEEPCAAALVAWEARVNGTPIIHVAHELGLSIGAAKALIKEVHDAIYEDLKENLSLNRQLDLERVDGLLKAFYPSAAKGDIDAAPIVLKALQHRAKLTGIEPLPDPGRSNPQGVLVWVQNALPSITKIVDSMPLELPPAAP
jgi:hypothetical protein